MTPKLIGEIYNKKWWSHLRITKIHNLRVWKDS